MSVEELNSSNFDEKIVNAGKIMLVDFSATWCDPCKMYGPIFHRFADKNAGKAAFGSIDIDESSDIAARYGITAVPTTIVFKDGQPIDSFMGAADEKTLEDVLARNL